MRLNEQGWVGSRAHACIQDEVWSNQGSYDQGMEPGGRDWMSTIVRMSVGAEIAYVTRDGMEHSGVL